MSFTLLNSDPDLVLAEWDIETAVQSKWLSVSVIEAKKCKTMRVYESCVKVAIVFGLAEWGQLVGIFGWGCAAGTPEPSAYT